MTQPLAVVVIRERSDGSAAPYTTRSLGYRTAVPRFPSLESISRRVPDLIVIDWDPDFIKANDRLVREIRSSAMLREVPICLFYSSEDDLPDGILAIDRLGSVIIPSTPETVTRVLERIGAKIPQRAASSAHDSTQVAGEALWDIIHPAIAMVAKSRFDSGQFADAAEAAMKEVNTRVKQLWTGAGKPEKDGKDLMLSTFSPQSPVVRLGDLSTVSGRNIQEGYMHIFAGAMQGIRNPKAHGNISITSVRCLHFLFLASLLMGKLDEAGAA